MPESFADKPSQALHAAEKLILSLCDDDAKRAVEKLSTAVSPEQVAVLTLLSESVAGDAVRTAHLARLLQERLAQRAWPAGLDVA
jgi:hypothetical protein